MTSESLQQAEPQRPEFHGIWRGYFAAIEAAARDAEITALIEPVLEVTASLGGSKAAALMLVEDGIMRLAGSHGLPPSVRARLVRGRPWRSSDPNHSESGSLSSWECFAKAGRMLEGCGFAHYRSLPVQSTGGEIVGCMYQFFVERRAEDAIEPSVLRTLCRILADRIDRDHILKELRYQTDHDAVSGAFNHQFLDRWCREKLARLRHGDGQAILLKLDPVRFALFNEILGYELGDLLLRAIALRIGSALPAEALLARVSGAAFAVALEGGETEGRQLAAELLASLRQPFEIADNVLRVNACIGMARFPQDGASLSELERSAGFALEAARQLGRNTLGIYSQESSGRHRAERNIEHQLAGALERGELQLYFQPLMRIPVRELESYEVLIRWHHPELGVISPGLFIPVAEKSGLIVPIGLWVLREACRLRSEWSASLPLGVRVSVNVSPVQFALPDFVGCVVAALASANLDANLLELELTESCVLADHAAAVMRIHQLREIGVTVAIDDFGTGYSSLTSVRDLPCDSIKLDRSFLAAGGASLMRRVIDIGRELGKRIVVEGVETAEQLCLAEELQCDTVQGYYFERPAPEEGFLRFVALGRGKE
jgi:diguanylate cyclase (GGDEF)-like protein